MNANAVVTGPECVELSVKIERNPEAGVIRYSCRIVSISHLMNGCDIGSQGTDLISSTSGIRKFASHR